MKNEITLNLARRGRLSLGLALGAAMYAGASAQAVTVSGVVRLPGATPSAQQAPLANTQIALISQAELGTAVVTGRGFRVTTTSATGAYSFARVPAGRYFLGPYTPGFLFRGTSAALVNGNVSVTDSSPISPVVLNLPTSSATLSVNFLRVAQDTSNPSVTISAPLAGTFRTSPPAIIGRLTDPVTNGVSGGTIGVGVAIFKGSTILNWRTGTFEAPRAPAPIPGLPPITNPLFNPVYYRVQLTSGFRFPATGTPTEIRGGFFIPLPALREAGSYRISMAGIDGSLRRSAVVHRDFIIGGTTPPPTTGPDTSAPTSSIRLVGTTSVANGTAQNPTRVTSFASVEGSATDTGTGVASVKLIVLKNLRNLTFFPNPSATADFWNGTSFETITLTANSNAALATKISALPGVTTTLTPAAGGPTVTWKRTGGLPTAFGDYGLVVTSVDKAGNKQQPDTLAGIGDLLALQGSIRTIRFSSTSGS